MIIATLTFGEAYPRKVTLTERGIWESSDELSMASMLNSSPQDSPRKRYGPAFGGRLAYYVRVAKEVAEKYNGRIEIAPLPEDTDPGLDENGNSRIY